MDTGQATKPSLDELESPSPVSNPASPVSLKRKRESYPPAPAAYTNSASVPTTQSYTSSSIAPTTQSYTTASIQPPTESYTSPYTHNAEIPWDQRLYTAPIPNKPYPPLPQPSYANETRPPLLDYVFQKQNPPNGKKRHHLLQRAQRDSLEPTATSRPSPLANGHGHTKTTTTYSVNAYTGDPVTTPHADSSTPASLSPSVQLQQPSWHYNTGKGVESPIFDGLPRKKQKQILGIIGGIQSGIRNARQTAEDLQRQLDGLQEVLGIGTDGDDEG